MFIQDKPKADEDMQVKYKVCGYVSHDSALPLKKRLENGEKRLQVKS